VLSLFLFGSILSCSIPCEIIDTELTPEMTLVLCTLYRVAPKLAPFLYDVTHFKVYKIVPIGQYFIKLTSTNIDQFSNFFSLSESGEICNNRLGLLLLKIPPHLKCRYTPLPCEMLV